MRDERRRSRASGTNLCADKDNHASSSFRGKIPGSEMNPSVQASRNFCNLYAREIIEVFRDHNARGFAASADPLCTKRRAFRTRTRHLIRWDSNYALEDYIFLRFCTLCVRKQRRNMLNSTFKRTSHRVCNRYHRKKARLRIHKCAEMCSFMLWRCHDYPTHLDRHCAKS